MAPPRIKDVSKSVLHKHVGYRYGDMVVIGVVRSTDRHTRGFKLLCKCDCGVVWQSREASVRKGQISRCLQCATKRTAKLLFKHGLASNQQYRDRPRAYNAWVGMKQRCYNKKAINYRDYGERGICVCRRWCGRTNGFVNFLEDMGHCPDGYTLERIDNDKNYEPANCRWAHPSEQNRNKRGVRRIYIDGKRLCGSQVAVECGMPATFVSGCDDAGLTGDEIVAISKIAKKMIAGH